MPLDDRIRQLSETLLEEVRGPIEVALHNVLIEVTKLAADDRDDAVREAVAAADERHQELVARLSAAEAQHQEQEARHSATEAEHQELVARLSAAEAQHQEQEARHSATEAEHQEQEARLSAAVAHAEQEQHRAEVERALVQQALMEARAEALAAREAGAAAADDLVSAREVAAAAAADLVSARAADRDRELACTDRLLDAFHTLDAARSLTEVLNALADHAAAETGRAAVLVVSGSRLHGWVLRGLGNADPATIDVPIEPYTVFGLALAEGKTVSTAEVPVGTDGDPLSTLLAAPAGSAGLAIPISVGGRTVAILYADHAGDRETVVPSTWPELVEILARHAGRCLEVLTMARARPAAGTARPHAEGDPDLSGRA
jgi:hypothetical protein